jgi:hypothetical protein
MGFIRHPAIMNRLKNHHLLEVMEVLKHLLISAAVGSKNPTVGNMQSSYPFVIVKDPSQNIPAADLPFLLPFL